MKRLPDLSPKASTILFVIVLVTFIGLTSVMADFLDEAEESKVNQVEQAKKDVHFTLVSEEYSLDDPDYPYQYVIEYEINEESLLIQDDELNVYEIKYVIPDEDTWLTIKGKIVSDKHTYEKLVVQGKEFYASSDETSKMENKKLVGTGLDVEDIRLKHPTAIFFGKGLPTEGSFVIKTDEEVNYDLLQKLYEDLAIGYPLANKKNKWEWKEY